MNISKKRGTVLTDKKISIDVKIVKYHEKYDLTYQDVIMLSSPKIKRIIAVIV